MRRPINTEFFQVCPGEAYQRGPFYMLELNEGRERWLLHPKLANEFSALIKRVRLRLAINTDEELFVWPLKLSEHESHKTALAAAEKACSHWVRMEWNRTKYKVHVAKEGFCPEPKWPGIPFSEILDMACQNLIIAQANHPVLKSLRGEK